MVIFPRKFGDRLVQPGRELTNPEPVVWRPLNFGADTKHSFSKITQLENLWADVDGWKPRPGLQERFKGISLDAGEAIIDYVDMGFMAEQYLTLSAITTKGIYWTLDGETWTRAKWYGESFSGTYNNGTMTVAGTGYYFSHGMRIESGAAHAVVDSATESGSTAIALIDVDGFTNGETYTFSVYYDFGNPEPYSIQWCKGINVIYLVDYTEGVFAYDGKYIKRFPIHDENGVNLSWSAATIAFVEGRLLLGNITGNATASAKALYWSDVLDVSLFRSINYVVFTASTGPVLKIASLENHLVVATQDDLYAGKPFAGDLSYTMPWVFRKLETLGNVPVGQSAILSVMNSVIYAGEHDLYMLSFKDLDSTGAFVVKPLESPTYQGFVAGLGSKYRVRMLYEPSTQCVVILPSELASKAMVISTRTGAESLWTFPVSITGMTRIFFSVRKTYGDIESAGTTYNEELATGHSYMYYLFGFGTAYMAVAGSDGSTYVFSELPYDTIGGTAASFPMIAQTGALDFDSPDDAKTMHKLTIRGDGTFRVDVTGNSTAKPLGVATIADTGEDELHFRLSGNRLSLRMVFANINNEDGRYLRKVDELVMLLKFVSEKIRRSEG